MLEINFVGIIVASIAAFIVGFLMHGPVGGKLWMKLANIVPTGKEKFSDMIPQMILNLLANIVIAFVLSVIYAFSYRYFAVSSYSYFPIDNNLISITAPVLLLWLFVIAGSSMDVIWMGKSKKLWIFECFSSLLTMIAMAAVILAW